MSGLVKIVLSLILLVSVAEAKKSRRAKAKVKAKPVIIAVLDTGLGNAHEQKVVEVLQAELKSCVACEIRTFPIYEKNGTLLASKVTEQLKKASQESSLLHLSWNIPSTPETLGIEKTLKELKAKNVVVVGAAGAPAKPSLSRPLSESVLGKSQSVFIVGEADTRGHLVSNSYYGSELTLIVAPPKGTTGSSFSSLLLTAALARKWHSKTPAEWIKLLEKKKKISGKVSLSDI